MKDNSFGVWGGEQLHELGELRGIGLGLLGLNAFGMQRFAEFDVVNGDGKEQYGQCTGERAGKICGDEEFKRAPERERFLRYVRTACLWRWLGLSLRLRMQLRSHGEFRHETVPRSIGWGDFLGRLRVGSKSNLVLAQLFLALCADMKMRAGRVHLEHGERTHGVQSEIGVGNVKAVVVHTFIAFRMVIRPARIRVLTVPRGEPVFSAISVWLKP